MEAITEEKDQKILMVILQKDIEFIKETVKDLRDYIHQVQESNENTKKENNKRYVTQDQFKPVKSIVYGLTAIVLSTVFIAILASIINKQ